MTAVGSMLHATAARAGAALSRVGPAGRRLLAGLTLVALCLAASPGAAAALEPLSQERYINDRLIAARIADRICRECPSIDGRLIQAFLQARKLKSYALQKGYSEAEIEAFLDSEADRKRIYATAEDYLARHGAAPGDPESFCRLGRDEIARKSVIGSLLIAK